MKSKRKNYGLTLLELLLVFLVISLLLMGIFSLYEKIHVKDLSNQTVDEINIIFNELIQDTGGSNVFPPSFDTVNNGIGIIKNVIPDYISGNSIISPFGTSIDIGTDSTSTNLWITIHDVPADACSSLVSNFSSKYKKIQVSNPEGVNGNGTIIQDASNGILYDPANAAADCAAAEVNSKVGITNWISKTGS
jgi:type II secretory pathway pseudopilin PulG